jgi:hypothetical protein
MSRVVKADHSGPSFMFSGVVSKDFAEEFLKWMENQAKEANVEGPSDVEMSKEGSHTRVQYEWGDSQITVEQKKDKISTYVSGDSQEIETPPSQMFNEATCVIGEEDAFLVHRGREYSLQELLELVKETERKKSIGMNSVQP